MAARKPLVRERLPEELQTTNRKRPRTHGGHYATPSKTGEGRQRVTPQVALRDAIILAAREVGEDRHGKGGLTGYLKWLAKVEPKAFASLLGKALPYNTHVTVENVEAITVKMTVEEAQAVYAETLKGLRLNPGSAPQLLAPRDNDVDAEYEDVT